MEPFFFKKRQFLALEGDAMERKNCVTINGNPLTLLGQEVAVGQIASDFKVLSPDLKEARLADFKSKVIVIAALPSLDTPVCDLEIKHFNQQAASLSKDVVIIFISMDLPFALARFCQAFDINQVKTFSDHRDADFGLKYGVLIKESRLLARTVFIVDRIGKIRYIERVKELTKQPDFEALLKALQDVV